MDPNDFRSKTSPALSLQTVALSRSPFAPYKSGSNHRFGADGSLFRKCEASLRSELRIHDFGLGGIEAISSPCVVWEEVEPMTASALADALACQSFAYPLTQQELLQKSELNDARSTRRACTKVRRLAKWKNLDTMLTLTYAENQTDRALMQKHFAAFARRVKRAIPGFEYVAVFERQKRGAWHCHMAVARIKSGYWVRGVYVHSWRLLRSIWRSVIAGGGNIDVKASGRPGRSISKLAGYLTKYICKDLHLADKYQNSYQASGADLPPPVVLFVDSVHRDALLVALVTALSPEVAAGRLYVSQPLLSGGYFLTLTPDS